jgi:hypothetical protein
MTELMLWARYLGAWLLVAGPVYQCALELEEENLERDELVAARAGLPEPARVSPLWWLVPPVGYWLHRRRDRDWRRQALTVLTAGQVDAVVRYVDKATGWLLVAGGAFLIAGKETWELLHVLEWPDWLFWIVVPVLLALAGINTSVNTLRANERVYGKEYVAQQREVRRQQQLERRNGNPLA